MPPPRPVPLLAVDHAQHDELLIAQYAAGDELDERQQREALQRVSSCRECALLSSDLRAISGAVAWEPLPARHRDFRIDAAKAEQLRGSRLSRFLRRISLPESRALSPVAAGVMSIGLLFVVAGSFWPAEQAPIVEQAPIATEALEAPAMAGAEPSAEEAPAMAGAEPSALPLASLSVEEPQAQSLAVVAEPSPRASKLGRADVAKETEAFADTDTSADGAAAPEMHADDFRDQARPTEGTADDRAEAASVSTEAAAGAPAVDASVATEARDVTPAAEAGVGTEKTGLDGGRAEGAAPVERAALETAAEESLPQVATPGTLGEVAAREGVAADQLDTADQAADIDQAAAAATAPTTPDAGPGLESIIVVIGAALAVAGAILLLLAWLARRSADPLLR